NQDTSASDQPSSAANSATWCTRRNWLVSGNTADTCGWLPATPDTRSTYDPTTAGSVEPAGRLIPASAAARSRSAIATWIRGSSWSTASCGRVASQAVSRPASSPVGLPPAGRSPSASSPEHPASSNPSTLSTATARVGPPRRIRIRRSLRGSVTRVGAQITWRETVDAPAAGGDPAWSVRRGGLRWRESTGPGQQRRRLDPEQLPDQGGGCQQPLQLQPGRHTGAGQQVDQVLGGDV